MTDTTKQLIWATLGAVGLIIIAATLIVAGPLLMLFAASVAW